MEEAGEVQAAFRCGGDDGYNDPFVPQVQDLAGTPILASTLVDPLLTYYPEYSSLIPAGMLKGRKFIAAEDNGVYVLGFIALIEGDLGGGETVVHDEYSFTGIKVGHPVNVISSQDGSSGSLFATIGDAVSEWYSQLPIVLALHPDEYPYGWFLRVTDSTVLPGTYDYNGVIVFGKT